MGWEIGKEIPADKKAQWQCCMPVMLLYIKLFRCCFVIFVAGSMLRTPLTSWLNRSMIININWTLDALYLTRWILSQKYNDSCWRATNKCSGNISTRNMCSKPVWQHKQKTAVCVSVSVSGAGKAFWSEIKQHAATSTSHTGPSHYLNWWYETYDIKKKTKIICRVS